MILPKEKGLKVAVGRFGMEDGGNLGAQGHGWLMVAVALSRGLSEESASVSAVYHVCFLLWPDCSGALLGDTEERLVEAGGEGRKVGSLLPGDRSLDLYRIPGWISWWESLCLLVERKK